MCMGMPIRPTYMRQCARTVAKLSKRGPAAQVVRTGDGRVAGAADLDDGVGPDQVGGDLGEPLGEPLLVPENGSGALMLLLWMAMQPR